MLIPILQSLFQRDLQKLRAEMSAYRDEKNIWRIEPDIANSAGNLCLHLIGNLNTYIGAQLGDSGYVRNRDLEFSLKDVPREELLTKIDATIDAVTRTLERLDPAVLEADYPIVVLKEKTSTAFFLTHLSAHLNYHLGQVNYHRRLIDKV